MSNRVRVILTESQPTHCIDGLLEDLEAMRLFLDIEVHSLVESEDGVKVIDVTFSSPLFDGLDDFVEKSLGVFRSKYNSNVEVQYV